MSGPKFSALASFHATIDWPYTFECAHQETLMAWMEVAGCDQRDDLHSPYTPTKPIDCSLNGITFKRAVALRSMWLLNDPHDISQMIRGIESRLNELEDIALNTRPELINIDIMRASHVTESTNIIRPVAMIIASYLTRPTLKRKEADEHSARPPLEAKK
jgi:hypothetical protein